MLHAAGVAVHSGTVPVERLWASLLDMFPTQARVISEDWFAVLADLSYLRYNYRHYHARTLPGWTETDSLLAARLDNLATFMRAMAEQDRDPSACDGLFEPFL